MKFDNCSSALDKKRERYKTVYSSLLDIVFHM